MVVVVLCCPRAEEERNPTMGDIGEKKKHIELEPLEVPREVPAEPVTVPEPETIPA